MNRLAYLVKNYNKVALSVTSWFRVPELGMTKFEVLSRGSTFAVKSINQKDNIYHFLAPFHVTAPYLFPGYYPRIRRSSYETEQFPWLQAVNENHVIYTIEFREKETGSVIKRLGVDNRIFSHSTRDVCCIHLNKEGEALYELKKMDLNIEALELSNENVVKGQKVTFLGHHLIEKMDEKTNEDISLLIPQTVEGELVAASQHRIFAKTNQVLTQGMCGGPILDENGICRGITEGVVSPVGEGIQFKDSQLQKRFENCGVFIDSTELLPFIEDLENDRFIGEEEIEKTIDKMDQESKEYLENLKNEEKKK